MLFLKLAMMMFLVILPAERAAAAEAGRYVVGVVPQFEARKLHKIWTPILKEIEKRSGIALTFKGVRDIPAFEQGLSRGEYDFAYMNPYHLIVANQEQGYLPLVRDVGRRLYGIIVVAKNSPIQRIADLDGKIVAFPAPNALGAALIPRAEFARDFNIDVVESYVKSHSSVYLNVALGSASAGGGVQKTLDRQPENIRSRLRVIYNTTKVAPHPIAAHPRIPASDVEKIRQAFIEMGATEAGAQLLAKIPMKKLGPASLMDYEPLKSLGLAEFYVK